MAKSINNIKKQRVLFLPSLTSLPSKSRHLISLPQNTSTLSQSSTPFTTFLSDIPYIRTYICKLTILFISVSDFVIYTYTYVHPFITFHVKLLRHLHHFNLSLSLCTQMNWCLFLSRSCPFGKNIVCSEDFSFIRFIETQTHTDADADTGADREEK